MQANQFHEGQRVIYTVPTNKKQAREVRAVVTEEFPNRVRLLVELAPGKTMLKMVTKDRVRPE